MGLRDLLGKRRDETAQRASEAAAEAEAQDDSQGSGGPTVTILPNNTQPSSPTAAMAATHTDTGLLRPSLEAEPSRTRRNRFDILRSARLSRSASTSSGMSRNSVSISNSNPSSKSDSRPDSLIHSPGKRLSQRLLHLVPHRETSERVPEDLPQIVIPQGDGQGDGQDDEESQWEQRATILAERNESAAVASLLSTSLTVDHLGSGGAGQAVGGARTRSPSTSSRAIDDDIQEAIRLHESGQLEQATLIFGRLADENGANNPLSQVLYGLALRHGWGCSPDPAQAVQYLTAAASNAASVEQLALRAGLKKGGAAKGELVLAIFELGNCFRHGWGIAKDPVAAKQYYETAANLGDSDAMNEVAWCYLEGYGCRKDKLTAARYYRLAEKAGNKTLGNSWIWKSKYDPPGKNLGVTA